MAEIRYYTPSEALSLEAPFTTALAVDVSGSDWDDADVEFFPRGIIVGVSGNVELELIDDTIPVTVYLTAGIPYSMRIKRILSGNTTAGNIVLFR